MLADIYKPELWNSFFTMVGGGVAALTGLVFVGLSLNLDNVTDDVTHKYRSINTLAGLAAVFVRCGLVLMAGQNHIAVGIDLFVIASIGAGIFVNGFRHAFKFKGQPGTQRLVIGSCLYLAELVGAVVLIGGSIVGLYIVAVAILLNVAFMISAAWLLVVGVYSEEMGK